MSKCCGLFAAVTVVLMTCISAAAPPRDSEAARLATFDDAKGDTYFALSLSANRSVPQAEAHDVVVLFDTSASQTGLYREDAFVALQSLVGNLRPEDRIKLMAIDLNAVEMTRGFVAPGSHEYKQGLAKLNARAPLGSTDLLAGLRAAAGSFGNDQSRPHSVIYVGDGVSRANLLSNQEMKQVVDKLVGNRVSVSSFSIGPQQDSQLLAALANHTGGMLVIDSSDQPQSAQAAGFALARIARTPVMWPTAATLPKSLKEVYPPRIPPLRADRDTIVIGRLDSREGGAVAVTAAGNGSKVTMQWDVRPENSNIDMGFLPQLVSTAKADQGLRLPTVGSAGLREVARMMQSSADQLSELGGQALKTGDLTGAQRVADAALLRDPNNPAAQAIRNAAQRQANAGEQNNIEADLKLVHFQPPGADPGPAPAGGGGSLLAEVEGEFLRQIDIERQALEEQMVKQVETGLEESRNMMDVDPDGAIDNLKLLLEQIDQSPDLGPEVRAQLGTKVESAVKQAQGVGTVVKARQAKDAAAKADAIAQERLLQEQELKQERIKQLMDRFNALMDEGRYQEASTQVAPEVRRLDPTNPTAAAADVSSHFVWNVRELEEIRRLRHKNFVDSLRLVERALIPFPDEPPIVYPSTDVWEELTLRRKKYASIDLAQTGGAEQRIYEALEEDTRIEFIDTPLADIVVFLEDQHNIEIEIDTKALDAIGLAPDITVTKNLKGISLRSGLRLMLKDLDLTYMVRDEVLLITTPEEVDGNLVTKVYPVGDLVLPITSGGSPLGGFGGGGFGNGFGGGGGIGGGFGAGGGFNQGGLGGGVLGGGAFDVDDELTLGAKKNFADQKKKTERAPRRWQPPQRVTVSPIEVKAEPGAAPQAWHAYFAKFTADHAKMNEAEKRQHLARVRATVRQMMGKAERAVAKSEPAEANKHFGDIVSFLHAAIHHGHPQPWMYEALGIALQAKGAPASEIERAVMSAVDFNDNPDAVMHAASYMASIGLDKRALSLYREIAEIAPFRTEPYLSGLRLAQNTNDLEAIQWASLGVLRQAWPEQHRKVETYAKQVAEGTVLELQRDGRKEEAAQFAAAIKKAQQRDCVIKVSWTGEADVDLVIEEPSGSVCSFRNPVSPGGGVLLGDKSTINGAESSLSGYNETYVCPNGFSGNYRVLIRKVWGEVTAGKVTLDVYLHQGTENEKHFRRQMELGDKNAFVAFGLEDGRRNQPLEQEAIAQAARVQLQQAQRARLAVDRAILAQQLNSLENSDAVRDFVQAWRAGAADGRLNQRFRRGGGVGFQPVIERFPEGTNLSATAVISADRRYVRISIPPVPPIFSGVGDVATFNIVSGQQGGQQGGNAGGVGGGPGIGGAGGGLGGGGFGGGGGGLGGGGFGGGGGGFGGGGGGFGGGGGGGFF